MAAAAPSNMVPTCKAAAAKTKESVQFRNKEITMSDMEKSIRNLKIAVVFASFAVILQFGAIIL